MHGWHLSLRVLALLPSCCAVCLIHDSHALCHQSAPLQKTLSIFWEQARLKQYGQPVTHDGIDPGRLYPTAVWQMDVLSSRRLICTVRACSVVSCSHCLSPAHTGCQHALGAHGLAGFAGLDHAQHLKVDSAAYSVSALTSFCVQHKIAHNMDIPQGQGNIERPHRWLNQQSEKQKGPLNRALFTLSFNCAKDDTNRMAQVTWGQGNETWGAIETHHDKKVVWPVPRANVGKRVFLCLPWRCGTDTLGTFKAPKELWMQWSSWLQVWRGWDWSPQRNRKCGPWSQSSGLQGGGLLHKLQGGRHHQRGVK